MGRKKKEIEEYVEMRGLLGDGKDYHVYHMTKKDFLIACALGFAGAFGVLFAFFDNLIVSCAGGLVCGKILPKHYREYKKRKQINELRTQFKDLLESLTSS